MEKNRLKGNLYDDLPSPEDEKPLKKVTNIFKIL